MLPIDTPKPKRKVSTNLCGDCLEPKRSTLRMSMPMLQETTASAVIAVSHSFTSSTKWPASNFDHSPTKERVLAKICDANPFTLI
eukprot:Skav233471  [mRNA]  locus=scaffold3626:23916:24170:- [translate_table: standard]